MEISMDLSFVKPYSISRMITTNEFHLPFIQETKLIAVCTI